MTTQFFQRTGMGLALAIGIYASVWLSMGGLSKFNSRNSISSRGYAQKKIISSSAKIKFSLNIKRMELPKAWQEMERQNQEVEAFLKSQGVKPSELDVSHDTISENKKTKKIKISEHETQFEEIFENYEIFRSFSVSSEDLEKIKKLQKSLPTLIMKGIDIRSGRALFLNTREEIENLKMELMTEATINARKKAEILFQYGNKGVPEKMRLIKASQGAFTVTSEDGEDGGGYETCTPEKIISFTVQANYAN